MLSDKELIMGLQCAHPNSTPSCFSNVDFSIIDSMTSIRYLVFWRLLNTLGLKID